MHIRTGLIVGRRRYRVVILFCALVIAGVATTAWIRGPNGMTLLFAIKTKPALDIDVSPDGTLIAVTGVSNQTDDYSFGGHLYDVVSGEITRSFPDGTANAAWSPDGSVLAIATSKMQVVEYASRGTATSTIGSPINLGLAGSLTYDRSGDLFACGVVVGERFANSPVFVWRRHGEPIRVAPHEIRVCPNDKVDGVSAAMFEGRLRMAIAHSEQCGVEIVTAESPLGDDQTFRKDFSMPGENNCWIRLAPSGKQLAILSSKGFRLFDLDTNPARCD
jgi:WD40 repeat protein